MANWPKVTIGIDGANLDRTSRRRTCFGDTHTHSPKWSSRLDCDLPGRGGRESVSTHVRGQANNGKWFVLIENSCCHLWEGGAALVVWTGTSWRADFVRRKFLKSDSWVESRNQNFNLILRASNFVLTFYLLYFSNSITCNRYSLQIWSFQHFARKVHFPFKSTRPEKYNELHSTPPVHCWTILTPIRCAGC